MLGLYIGALVLGGGILLAQALLGGSDASGDAGLSDASADSPDGDLGGFQGLPVLTFLASVRFWSFAALAFGMVGTLLTVFGLAGATAVLALAAGSGLASGATAVVVIRKVLGRPSTSHATAHDLVGRVARVLVPVVPGGRGKIRVAARGSYVDLLARSEETIEAGETVIVTAYEGMDAVVVRAPQELAP